MTKDTIDRRSVIGASAAIAAALAFARQMAFADKALAQEAAATPPPAPATPEPPPAPAFTAETVNEVAKKLATSDFAKPTIELPAPFNKLSYDQYRDIRFRKEQAIWKGDKLDFELQLFPMGWLYETPVDMYVVEDGTARKLVADGPIFNGTQPTHTTEMLQYTVLLE